MSPSPSDPTVWSRAREIFLDLAELDPSARDEELARLRADEPELAEWVARLLAKDAEPDPLSDVPAAERLGPYEITERVAEGGMGEVFRARRVDGEFEREVAVKLLRSRFGDEELVRRFHRERQTLAQLDHEYVARLLDGGTTEDGRPYLVMEYVEGEPLDVFCRVQKLEVPERLELFLKVCAAVQHAHENGVVHRDLKPNNILVRADATPRLLDFGIARPQLEGSTPAGPLTRTGARLFTPEYASPEQVRGEEVSEATDVFALGVLLYELLSGRRPWGSDLALHELERAICEADPLPPSRLGTGTWRRALAGDLDTIALKCLEKDVRNRYAHVADLRLDLERHLKGYPILARRTNALQRAWRYGRRKPWRAIGLAGLAAAALTTFVALRVQAESERRREALFARMEGQVEAARQLRVQGKLAAAGEELSSVLETLVPLGGDPTLHARVLTQLAAIANEEKRHDDALAHCDEGLTLIAGTPVGTEEVRASFLTSRTYALAAVGREEEALVSAREALEHCRAALEPGHVHTVDALLGLTNRYRARDEYERVTETLEEAVAEARLGPEPKSLSLGHALNLWGLALADVGRHEEAVEKLLEALEILRWNHGGGHPSIGQVRTNLGESYYQLARHDEAEEQHRQALEVYRLAGDEVRAAASQSFLARAAYGRGELGLAEERFREALEIRERVLHADDPARRQTLLELGVVLEDAGRAAEALGLFEAALAVPRKLEHPPLSPVAEGMARFRLGRQLHHLGAYEAAQEELGRALEVQEQALGSDHPQTRATRQWLGVER